MIKSSGTLFVVATPIGNLEDITLRAKRVLNEVNLIAAENTQHSKKLLQHLHITTPLLSLHMHNENRQSENIIARLKAGENVALITDAGTPVVSDPGGRLVLSAHRAKISVMPVPGPCALIAALSICGLPADSFYFAGFLSSKKGTRQQALKKLKNCEDTLVFYEAPHRIVECIADMQLVFGKDRYAVICRELTKVYETTFAAELGDMYEWLLANSEQQQGEFVIIVQGAVPSDDVDVGQRRVLELLIAELPHKQAVNLAAKITGASKNKLYDLALSLK